MSKLTVVAKLVAKKGCAESVKSELLKLIEPSRKEDGCLEYRLHQDNQDPDTFIFYETWEDTASIERHVNTEHYKSYAANLADLLQEKTVHKLTKIA